MKYVFVLFLTFKTVIFLIMFFSASLLPYSREMYERNFIYPSGEKHSLRSAFKSWDAQHYLYLSQNGYHQGQVSNAFYPLFPLLISGVTFIVKDSFWAGMFVANIASVGAVYFLYRFIKANYNDEIAQKSLLLLLTFPTAFYLSLIYTEALFLFLIAGFFYFLSNRRYLLSGLLSLFLPLTRSVGLVMLLPMLSYFVFDKKKKTLAIQLPSFNEKVVLHVNLSYLYLIFPILGVGLYFLFMKYTTGDYFSGMIASKQFVGGFALENLLAPSTFINSFFSSHLSLHGFTDSIIDRAFFVFFLFCVILIYKKLDKTLLLYSLSLGLVPLLGSFGSYTRYLLPIFPMYIALALIFANKRFSFLYLPFAFFSFSLQIFFVVLYSLNYWVS